MYMKITYTCIVIIASIHIGNSVNAYVDKPPLDQQYAM